MIVDLSKHNGNINYDLMVSRGVDGAILRASIGEVIDPKFRENWNALVQRGVDTSAYLVVYPGVSAQRHLDIFYRITEGCELSQRFLGVPVLDVEIVPQDKRAYSKLVADISDALTSKYGKRPVIYTRQTYWDFYILQNDIWREHPLWVALYVQFKASGNEFIPVGNVWGAGNRFYVS